MGLKPQTTPQDRSATDQRDQALSLRDLARKQPGLDMARLGAEITRMARAAAALHAHQHAQQHAEAAQDQARQAQLVRDQAYRLRGLMRGTSGHTPAETHP